MARQTQLTALGTQVPRCPGPRWRRARNDVPGSAGETCGSMPSWCRRSCS